MKNEITKIGVITYKNYNERVLLDETFLVDDLIKIIENEPTFRKFEVIDGDDVILLVDDLEDQEKLNEYFGLVDRKHYTLISLEETEQAFETFAKKNKLKLQIDGFGDSRVGGEHHMYTFNTKQYKGVIVNAMFELKQYGGTRFNVELIHPKISDHYFTVFETDNVQAVFNFLKRRNGDYLSLIKKEDKRLEKVRQAEYEQYKKDARKYRW